MIQRKVKLKSRNYKINHQNISIKNDQNNKFYNKILIILFICTLRWIQILFLSQTFHSPDEFWQSYEIALNIYTNGRQVNKINISKKSISKIKIYIILYK